MRNHHCQRAALRISFPNGFVQRQNSQREEEGNYGMVGSVKMCVDGIYCDAHTLSEQHIRTTARRLTDSYSSKSPSYALANWGVAHVEELQDHISQEQQIDERPDVEGVRRRLYMRIFASEVRLHAGVGIRAE